MLENACPGAVDVVPRYWLVRGVSLLVREFFSNDRFCYFPVLHWFTVYSHIFYINFSSPRNPIKMMHHQQLCRVMPLCRRQAHRLKNLSWPSLPVRISYPPPWGLAFLDWALWDKGWSWICWDLVTKSPFGTEHLWRYVFNISGECFVERGICIGIYLQYISLIDMELNANKQSFTQISYFPN